MRLFENLNTNEAAMEYLGTNNTTMGKLNRITLNNSIETIQELFGHSKVIVDQCDIMLASKDVYMMDLVSILAMTYAYNDQYKAYKTNNIKSVKTDLFRSVKAGMDDLTIARLTIANTLLVHDEHNNVTNTLLNDVIVKLVVDYANILNIYYNNIIFKDTLVENHFNEVYFDMYSKVNQNLLANNIDLTTVVKNLKSFKKINDHSKSIIADINTISAYSIYAEPSKKALDKLTQLSINLFKTATQDLDVKQIFGSLNPKDIIGKVKRSGVAEVIAIYVYIDTPKKHDGTDVALSHIMYNLYTNIIPHVFEAYLNEYSVTAKEEPVVKEIKKESKKEEPATKKEASANLDLNDLKNLTLSVLDKLGINAEDMNNIDTATAIKLILGNAISVKDDIVEFNTDDVDNVFKSVSNIIQDTIKSELNCDSVTVDTSKTTDNAIIPVEVVKPEKVKVEPVTNPKITSLHKNKKKVKPVTTTTRGIGNIAMSIGMARVYSRKY